jgi:hypothetical protein
MNKKIGLLLAGALLLAGCQTIIRFQTEPPKVKFQLKNLALEGTTDQQVIIPGNDFGSYQTIMERIILSLEGYWTEEWNAEIVKNTVNKIVKILYPLDTWITIDSTPPGALITLAEPFLGVIEFITPYTFAMPGYIAEMNKNMLVIQKAFLQGYLADSEWKNKPIKFDRTTTTKINIPLSPVITTIRVQSTPSGADVEDVEESGFGLLGKTPLEYKFNYPDLKRWASKKRVVKKQGEEEVLQDFVGADYVILTLKISKPGYEDTFIKNISVPIGEERAFTRNLREQIMKISFDSDPAGATVYVLRTT